MSNESKKNYVEYFVAGTAAFVSLTTLCVYIYQAKIMKEQQRIGVWPYVEWLTSNTDDYHFTVRNKGIGPAIIKKVEMTLDGQPIANNAALVHAVLGKDSTLQWNNSTVQGRVLSPNEEVISFAIPNHKDGLAFENKLATRDFNMTISYCSVYGDCWISSGITVKPDDHAGHSGG